MTQHPPVRHPKNLVLGFHGWDEIVSRGRFTWSVVFIFFWAFFSSYFFFPNSLFFLWGLLFYYFFFWATPDPILYFGNSYLPLQPTYCPASLQPIYLPPPVSFCLSHSFLFCSPPYPALEKQAQIELALGFS